VTHDQTEALTMSDRVAVLAGGSIVQIDDPKTLYDHPKTRFVADFVGQSNTFDILEIAGGSAKLKDLNIRIPIEEASARAICVRPERIQLAPEKVPDSLVVFEGTLIDETFFGSILAQTIRLPSGRELERRCQRSLELQTVSVGSEIKLGFDRADMATLVED
jgi:ABC-type Fe3+/spermidine/putrescine transport system ATPase subunit